MTYEETFAALRALFEEHAVQGEITMRYQTVIVTGCVIAR